MLGSSSADLPQGRGYIINNDFLSRAVTKLPRPTSGRPFGKKEDGSDARLAQARLWSELMQTRRPFCFLGMGDMEVPYLLGQQYNRLEELDFGVGSTSGTQAHGNPGLSAKQVKRLRRAYESADYVDFHEGHWSNEHLIPKLNLDMTVKLAADRNPRVLQRTGASL